MTDMSSIPMLAGEWRLRLSELCRDCALADSGEQADMLRLARSLLSIAPDDAQGIDPSHLPGVNAFERLLDAGAWESAALDLMPDEASFMLSRSGDSHCMASITLPGLEEEVTSEADTPAMAMVSALAAGLAMLPAAEARAIGRSRHDAQGDGRDVIDNARRRAIAARLH